MLIDHSKYDIRTNNTTFIDYYRKHSNGPSRRESDLAVEEKSKIVEFVLMRMIELNFISTMTLTQSYDDQEIVFGSDIFNVLADYVEDKFALTGGYIDGLSGMKFSELALQHQRRIKEAAVHYTIMYYGDLVTREVMKELISILRRTK